jgi:hypothetical protein
MAGIGVRAAQSTRRNERLGAICTLARYFFGRIKAVMKHFEMVVVGIVVVLVLPLAWE